MVKETLSQKIISKIGKTEYINPVQFSEMFRISPEQSLELLDEGVRIGVFIIALENSKNGLKSMYGVKEIINSKESEKFSKFVETYFGDVKEGVVLSVEELELREKILTLLLLNKRYRATELIVNKIQTENNIYSTRDDIKSEMWIYDKGIYVPQGKTFIKETCRKILESVYTSHFANEVIVKIEADTFIEQDKKNIREDL